MNTTESTFSHAKMVYSANFDREAYLDRTQRNHFWIGGGSGQERTRKLRIAVAGLGGMGSNIAEALVRIGVGHLRIADPDHIERTNINRQVIASSSTIGKSKALASAERLRDIAADFELAVYPQGVEERMVDEFVAGCDAVVDEIDVFPLDRHVLLHRSARKYNIPVYSAYVVGAGIHFYKFAGPYSFEDFLKDNRWQAPTAEYLLEKFGFPLPSYLDEESVAAYLDEIAKGTVPIFGPATLLGHSLVVTRLIMDLLDLEAMRKGDPTPVMPEFLVLDPLDFSFQRVRVPNR